MLLFPPSYGSACLSIHLFMLFICFLCFVYFCVCVFFFGSGYMSILLLMFLLIDFAWSKGFRLARWRSFTQSMVYIARCARHSAALCNCTCSRIQSHSCSVRGCCFCWKITIFDWQFLFSLFFRLTLVNVGATRDDATALAAALQANQRLALVTIFIRFFIVFVFVFCFLFFIWWCHKFLISLQRELDISQNYIEDRGVTALSNWLSKMHNGIEMLRLVRIWRKNENPSIKIYSNSFEF